MRTEELYEMAVTKRIAEIRIAGLEEPLNEHLIKILALEANPDTRESWRKEVRGHVRKIQSFRLKPHSRPGNRKFYHDLLWEGPFGDFEITNVRSIINGLVTDDDYNRNTAISDEDIVKRLEVFHDELANILHQGGDAIPLINKHFGEAAAGQ